MDPAGSKGSGGPVSIQVPAAGLFGPTQAEGVPSEAYLELPLVQYHAHAGERFTTRELGLGAEAAGDPELGARLEALELEVLAELESRGWYPSARAAQRVLGELRHPDGEFWGPLKRVDVMRAELGVRRAERELRESIARKLST